MADIDLSSEVNWSTCNAGDPPASGDSVFLNDGAILHLDGADASTYTCVAIKAATSAAPTTYNQNGYIVLDNATSTIASALVAGAADLITLTVAANKTLTITSIVGGSASTKRGVYSTGGTHAVTLGTVTGGPVSNAHGIYIQGGTVTVTVTDAYGSATSGGGHGVYGTPAAGSTILNATGGYNNSGAYINGPCTITNAYGGVAGTTIGVRAYGAGIVVTNATGGSVSSAYGVQVDSNGQVIVGTAKGGSVSGSVGAYTTGTGILTVNGTDLTGTAYPVGVSNGTLKVAAGVKLQFHNASEVLTKYYDPTLMPSKGKVAVGEFYGDTDDQANYDGDAGTLEGTRVDAAVENVWKGSGLYGDPDAQLTPTKIAASIPTDSGTLEAADIVDGVIVDPGADQIEGTAEGGGSYVRRGGALRGA